MKVVAKPIEMVAWFTMDGCPNPMRFRLANDDASSSVIKVGKVLHRGMEKIAGNNTIVFKCQSVIKDSAAVYEIKYELRTQRWILFKI